MISLNKWINKSEKYSKIGFKSDNADWVLTSIANEMKNICSEIGIDVINQKNLKRIKNQCVFFTSKYDVLNKWKKPKNKIAFPYYHGNPNTDKLFNKMVNNIIKHHQDISRIQVSNSEVEDIILNTGIDSNKVFLIPISIDLDLFSIVDNFKRSKAREKLNINEDALVIGSFQKDGNGWGKGNEPKLIKGPDLLLDTIKILNDKIANIEVLLTGPSRGYVKTGLNKIGVPYKHFLLIDYSEISKYYEALDLYIVTSREEGGPRAILESMASGIPLVSTRVGQAIDLVEHNKNGWMVDVEDIDGLVYWSKFVIGNSDSIANVKLAARKTAEDNCYEAQIPLWKNFMNGFVNY